MANGHSSAENKHHIHPKEHFSEYLLYNSGGPSDYDGDSVRVSPHTQHRINNFLRKHRFGHTKKGSEQYPKVNRHRKTDNLDFIKSLKGESDRLSYRTYN